MGGKDLDILMQHYKSGLPPPKRIAEAPELLAWLTYIWNAFWELSTCRAETAPIPWTAIHLYTQANDIDSLEYFTELIRGMDKVYVQHIAKSNKPIGKSNVKEKGKLGRK